MNHDFEPDSAHIAHGGADNGPPTLEQFHALARERRATRHFKADPVPGDVLERILDCARWAPSGYNLQPAHFVVVTAETVKKQLFEACMHQPQILEAPVVVVFTGDRRVMENHFEKSMARDLEEGAVNAVYVEKMRKFVPLAFNRGPLGLGWLWKAMLPPLARFFTPVPSIPAVHKRYWLAKQVMLAAMNFMLAAKSAGLATVPMEGFDEPRVKRILSIPRHHIAALVVPLGHPLDNNQIKTRLPLEDLVHYNGW